jgi:hypothetical protein
MQTLRMRHLIVVLVGVAAAAAGCGGSSGQSPAQAKAEITSTWETFFSANGNANQLQGMTPQLLQTYKTKVSTALPKGLSAKVKSIDLQSGSACQANGVPSPCATVTYDLDAGGSTLLPGSKGYAARTGGKWLVSKATFCSLLALESGGTPPAGC